MKVRFKIRDWTTCWTKTTIHRWLSNRPTQDRMANKTNHCLQTNQFRPGATEGTKTHHLLGSQTSSTLGHSSKQSNKIIGIIVREPKTNPMEIMITTSKKGRRSMEILKKCISRRIQWTTNKATFLTLLLKSTAIATMLDNLLNFKMLWCTRVILVTSPRVWPTHQQLSKDLSLLRWPPRIEMQTFPNQMVPRQMLVWFLSSFPL